MAALISAPLTAVRLVRRNMVPSNLIEATFQQVSAPRAPPSARPAPPRVTLTPPRLRVQYKTDLAPILKVPARTATANFVYVVPGDAEGKGRTVLLELTPPPEVTYKTSPGSSQQMNVLGIVIFSATMGESRCCCAAAASRQRLPFRDSQTNGASERS